MNKQFPVLVIWSQYGPYHIARLREFAARGHGCEVMGVELGSRSATYEWSRDAGNVPLTTLCRGKIAEEIGPMEVLSVCLKYFVKIKPAVVMIPSYWPFSSVMLILAGRLCGARLVMMNDSHAGTAKVTGWKAWVKKRLILQFDAALVAGTPQLEYYTRMGFRPDRIFTGYDVVDNEFFSNAAANVRLGAVKIRIKRGLPERYFLSVGRMVHKKNLSVLIDAFACVRRKLGRVCPRLVLVGSGVEYSLLVERCSRHNLVVVEQHSTVDVPPWDGADVIFTGFRQVDELTDYYALAEAFVLPSYEEEWGLVVNEAMASGVAVVVSQAAGCAQDLVRSGLNGFTFEPDDTAELSRSLEVLALDRELGRRFGEHSRSLIAEWDCDRFALSAEKAVYAAQTDRP